DLRAAAQTADALKHQPLARASALEEIALAQAQAGDRAAALKSLAEALRLNDATLADEPSKNQARAQIAVKRAKAGDIEGALPAAAGLRVDPKSGYHDKGYALRHIAAEQAKRRDVSGALQTAQSIKDGRVRVEALTGIAEAQAEGGDREAGQKALADAQRVAEALT